MLEHFSFGLQRTTTDLLREVLQWQPDPEANNIAVTVWHICRALNHLKVKILENQPDQKQFWVAVGWASRTTRGSRRPAGITAAGAYLVIKGRKAFRTGHAYTRM